MARLALCVFLAILVRAAFCLECRSTDAAQSAVVMRAQPRCGDAGAMGDVSVVVEATALFEGRLAVGLVLLGVLVGASIFLALLREWFVERSSRAWLLLACLAPLSFLFQKIFALGWRHFEGRRWLRVEVDSLHSHTLFHALADYIAEVAESGSATCSSDMEGFVEYDKATGCSQVRLRYWGSRSRYLLTQLSAPGGSRGMVVQYDRGEDLTMGRDHKRVSPERLVLRMAVSGDPSADKVLMRSWLLKCVQRYKEPQSDCVEVYALDQSCADWVPEWKLRSVRRMRRSDGVGHGFFLQQRSVNSMVADACTWCGKDLRTYMIVGPPGSGKTELTVWLAGYLRVALYRISLNDPRLTDQVFAQMLSPTTLSHDNALIQLDEFQETLKRWRSGHALTQGVSIGGFCEVLQGSASLARGFFVLSGTSELEAELQDPVFAAVFRRVAVITTLGWLLREDLQDFFCRFVVEFTPEEPEASLRRQAERFTGTDGPWGRAGISIDMAKQYLMKRISSFRVLELPEVLGVPDELFRVPPERRACFFDHLCDAAAGCRHLLAYPPVHLCGIGTSDVSSAARGELEAWDLARAARLLQPRPSCVWSFHWRARG